ncbi:MAG: NUDIX hydrolase [Myxococcaceae bacterium]|nr:NUDIX hydrolase [Myxococcaceae bacterium]
MANTTVTDIEVVEDLTASSRCDKGFLHVRRLRAQNRRGDGTVSEVYRIDMVERPRLDAVAVLIHRRSANGAVEVLTRLNLRPAAYFRKDRDEPVPDGRVHLFTEEIVAGLLEPTDRGEEGLRHRAAEEVKEEAGFEVTPAAMEMLGGPFFVAPGILSEKIFLCAVDVTHRAQIPPRGDGSPLEEGGQIRWRTLDELIAACASGEIQDAKTEIAASRFRDRLSGSFPP